MVRMRSAVRICPAAPKKHRKLRFSMLFCCKNAENSARQNVSQLSAPHRDPHNEMCGKSQRAPERRLCLLSGILCLQLCYNRCKLIVALFQIQPLFLPECILPLEFRQVVFHVYFRIMPLTVTSSDFFQYTQHK